MPGLSGQSPRDHIDPGLDELRLADVAVVPVLMNYKLQINLLLPSNQWSLVVAIG